MALTLADLRTDEQLKEENFRPADIELLHDQASKYWCLVLELDEAEAAEAKDYDAILALEDTITIIEFRLLYMGKHPKEIPFDALAKFTRASLSETTNDYIVSKYRARIKNPATGMRAFCVSCMGGQVNEVRLCEAVNCPLWPFRFGNNPLAGRVMPPVESKDIEGDDVGNIDESTDSGDAEE